MLHLNLNSSGTRLVGQGKHVFSSDGFPFVCLDGSLNNPQMDADGRLYVCRRVEKIRI